MDALVIRISQFQPDSFGDKIAWFIYAINSPFRLVQSKHFINVAQSSWWGYTLLAEQTMLERYWTQSVKMKLNSMQKKFTGNFINLSLDVWSNVHNDPIICACVTTEDGVVYLTRTIDTSGNIHVAEYLPVAVKAITSWTKIKARSIIDNAANVAKMRRYPEENNEGTLKLIT